MLTRGPVHEAFAETITFDPEPGIVAPQAPPADIEEVPPQQRPEGKNLAWIPGYWAWDDERNDFLWLSGIWRALPPGRQWVPGYWGQSQQGAQWTSGYWADAAASEIEYLPEPPATVEAGPNIAAPSADDIWLPGCWVWQQNRYAWRPGYWTKGNQDWDWVPDHYVWTPSGYVFVDGYYDYSVPRRGIVFAPVYFQGGLRTQRGFSYSPSTVINPGVFVNHLFLRPGYGHYYFGDYYGSNYANARVFPLVLVPLQPPRLRSDLRQPALAASAGPRVGATRRKPTSGTYVTMRTPGRRATGRRKQHSPRREKHPTEGISGSPSGSKSWLREKIASCDSNRWIQRSDNSLASVGRSTVSTCSSDNSWKPTRRTRQAEILPLQPGRHEGNSPVHLRGTARRPAWQGLRAATATPGSQARLPGAAPTANS